MNKYKITYLVKESESISPLFAEVWAESEDLARIAFYAKRDFYNTVDCNKIVIESIRRCKI